MLSRIWLILMVVAAQLAGAGSLTSTVTSNASACGPAVQPERTRCCGEGCQCTPESCPCARPADPARQIPVQSPAPAPTAPRIDLHHAQTIVIVPVADLQQIALSPPSAENMIATARAKFRASIGTWIT